MCAGWQAPRPCSASTAIIRHLLLHALLARAHREKCVVLDREIDRLGALRRESSVSNLRALHKLLREEVRSHKSSTVLVHFNTVVQMTIAVLAPDLIAVVGSFMLPSG